uniref:LOB domain-containing protein n=1 Tax=Arundo donax TaxID=35708 RepID=A0A0A9ARX1_ARUDO
MANAVAVVDGGGRRRAPCAVCKMCRRRCAAGCLFAPFFSPDSPTRDFANVRKVFGAGHVKKLLQVHTTAPYTLALARSLHHLHYATPACPDAPLLVKLPLRRRSGLLFDRLPSPAPDPLFRDVSSMSIDLLLRLSQHQSTSRSLAARRPRVCAISSGLQVSFFIFQ